MLKVNKNYCMSSYLMYRALLNDQVSFAENIVPRLVDENFERKPVTDSKQLMSALKECIATATKDGTAALALSGGIDSAILARLVPDGTVAYTFKCIVPGKCVIDETERAAYYAKQCGLEHRIVEIYWEDMEEYAPYLMKHKGAPIHSIEVQIYKAAMQAKKDGFSKMIFGENADIIYGGMNGLLAKNWLFGEFVDRYSYVMPYKVLRDAELILEPFKQYEKDGHIDGHDFINQYFRKEALGTYFNACESAGIEFVGPYSETYLSVPIDYERIRSGDTKYLVREVYKMLYPENKLPEKIPMPRPMNEWMASWNGPTRSEFYPNCHLNMTGDQKWMIYALEKFLNILEDKHGL